MKRDRHLLNGQRAPFDFWYALEFDRRWADPGPSPAGNPGPYWKVPHPNGTVHRVYCRRTPCPDGCHQDVAP